MAHVKINIEDYGLNYNTTVEVDGINLTTLIEEIDLSFKAGCLGRLKIDIPISSCEINSNNSMVEINGTPLPDELSRQIYEDLKNYFE